MKFWKYLQSTFNNIISYGISNKTKFLLIISYSVCENHTSSLINIEDNFNRRNSKFYNNDDLNVIVAELRLTKTRPTSFYKRHNIS